MVGRDQFFYFPQGEEEGNHFVALINGEEMSTSPFFLESEDFLYIHYTYVNVTESKAFSKSKIRIPVFKFFWHIFKERRVVIKA